MCVSLSSDSEVSCNTPAVRSQQSCSSLETSPHVHLPPQHHIACFPNHTETENAPRFWVSVSEEQNILEFVPRFWLVLVSISLKTHEKQCKIQCWLSQQGKTHRALFSTVVGLCLSWNSTWPSRSHITDRKFHGNSEREASSGGNDPGVPKPLWFKVPAWSMRGIGTQKMSKDCIPRSCGNPT